MRPHLYDNDGLAIAGPSTPGETCDGVLDEVGSPRPLVPAQAPSFPRLAFHKGNARTVLGVVYQQDVPGPGAQQGGVIAFGFDAEGHPFELSWASLRFPAESKSGAS